MTAQNRYTYETTLNFDGERADYAEIDVTVSFDVSWGRPASRLGPAEDDEVSDITLVKVGDRFAPWGFHTWSDKHFAALVEDRLMESEDHLCRMLEIANEEEVAIEDRLSEARWEDHREEAA